MLKAHSNVALRLAESAERDGGRSAFVDTEGRIDYATLAARAAAFARLFAESARPDDRVAVFLERGSDAAAVLYGAYAAGAVAVVVNERYRPRQIEYVLRHSGAELLVTSQQMLERLHRDIDTPARIVDVSTVGGDGHLAPERRISPDLAQIIYTSGSTGMPKGVVYTHGALQAGIDAVVGYLGLLPSDRVASLIPFSSVYGLNQLLTSVACGAAVLVERSPVANQMVSALAKLEATVLAAVPPLWIQLLGAPSFVEGALGGLRLAQNAGGHLPPEIVRRVRAALPSTRLFLQYGMTETFRGTYLPPEELDRRPGSMGKAMPDTEIELVGEDGGEVRAGEVGEIVHRGPTLALGYWGDPEGTQRTFRPNPLRPADAPAAERVVYSGDMARRDEEGFLYYVSRRERMIKSMGFRVGPDEIADVLHASGEIAETVIDAVADAERGERIVAYVVLREGGSAQRLERYCRAELPAYELPAEYVVRAELPRLASGKYDMEGLRLAGRGSEERKTTARS